MKSWKPFWFDSQMAWGRAGSPEEWAMIRANWAIGEENAKHQDAIYDATSATFENHALGGTPSFGFRPEHRGGTQTLRDFFAAHGMTTE